jgi:DNA-binding NarL/FixJ family response regulator
MTAVVEHAPGAETLALSPRELEVLDLVADGLSNAEIGRRLVPRITVATVKTTLANMAPKLGTGVRAGMVGAGYRRGLLVVRPLPAGVRLPELSVATWAVLPLVARGMTDAEIATEVGAPVDTVHKRVARLLHEFGVSSRAHLVRASVDAGALTSGLALAGSLGGPALVGGVLPPREAQALGLVARGMSDRVVGEVLGLSESRAGELVRQAARKLGAANKTHAVFIACGLGILQPAGTAKGAGR